jgi:Lon protease-like protein
VLQTFDPKDLARKLAGPEGIAAFDDCIREIRAGRFEGAFIPAEAASLFDIARLERAISNSAIPVEQIDIFSRGHIVRLPELVHKSGRTVLDVAAEELGAGATLRVRDLQRADPDLLAFVHSIQETFAATAQINLYLTPARQEGFPPHFDITDVFIVQIAGSKSWRIHSDYADRKPLPTADTPWEPQHYRPIGAAEELTLRTGDVLYIPRGEMHSAATLDDDSMHLTIGLAALTYADLLAAALARVAKQDLAFRRRVPLRTGHAAVEAETRELIDRLNALLELPPIIKAELQRLAAPDLPEAAFRRALEAQRRRTAD